MQPSYPRTYVDELGGRPGRPRPTGGTHVHALCVRPRSDRPTMTPAPRVTNPAVTGTATTFPATRSSTDRGTRPFPPTPLVMGVPPNPSVESASRYTAPRPRSKTQRSGGRREP